jgi:hypothetical protein
MQLSKASLTKQASLTTNATTTTTTTPEQLNSATR